MGLVFDLVQREIASEHICAKFRNEQTNLYLFVYIERKTCLFFATYIRHAEAFLFSNILAHIIWHSPQSSKDFFRKRNRKSKLI